MVDVTIKMSVPSDKRMEVLQTIKSLFDPIRNEQGCLSCYCCVDAEAENIIFFKQEWKTNEDLAAHLKSDHFSILLGAMKLLCIEPEVRFNTIASTAGEEAITAVRTPMKTRLDDRKGKRHNDRDSLLTLGDQQEVHESGRKHKKAHIP